jgi:hypothetical protein
VRFLLVTSSCGTTQRPNPRTQHEGWSATSVAVRGTSAPRGPRSMQELGRLGLHKRSPRGGLAPPTPTSEEAKGVDTRRRRAAPLCLDASGPVNEDTRRPRAPTPLTRRRGAPPCLTRDLTGRAGSRCPPLVHRRAHIYRQTVIKARKGARRRQSGPRHRGRVHSRSRARRPRGPPSQPVVRSDGGGREDAETRSISQKTS